ncbi:type II secretion system protein [Candidatus Riflebacteria bacterium]
MKKSFSLVELLIVVTIISVLAGAAVPFVSEYLESARIAKAKNDLDEFAKAINAYEATTGKTYGDTSGTILKGRFLQTIPVDPWGGQYSFGSATDELGCKVGSKGPDGLLAGASSTSGDDDIVVAYKGPLALVAATWYDVDLDSSVNNNDTLKMKYNRNPDGTTGIAVANYAIATGSTPVNGLTLANLCTAAGTKSGRTVTFILDAVANKDTALGSMEIGPDTSADGTSVITDPQGLDCVIASVTFKGR